MSDNTGGTGGAVVPAASFPQGGQVDWVAASNSVASASYQILHRLADAGIHQRTHHAGLLIANKFRLSEKGHERVSDALSKLRPYHGFESVLWFGFGHKSYLALLTEQELGLNCAALCACLGEAYGSARASQLLQAVWRTNDFPETSLPSRSEFRALVDCCNGLLLSTPFPDVLQRMAGPYKRDGLEIPPTTAPDLAKAINALFHISKGVLKAISIIGGCDIAFLAAVAYWLFDLSIWVQMHDGTKLFANCSYAEEANVCFYYAEVNEMSRSPVRISTTTFILRSVEDLIVDDPYSPITFRLQWTACLAELFHGEIEDILQQAALLGKLLGAVARIYQAIVTCEADVGGLSRTHFTNFQPRGYGESFINSICALLPEIGSNGAFLEGAQETLNQSVTESVTAVQILAGHLRARCSCAVCRGKPAKGSRYYSCNVTVALFLRCLGDIMTHVEPESQINPTLHGLRSVYGTQASLWNRNSLKDSFLGMVMGIPHASDSLADIKGSSPRGQMFLLDCVLGQVSRLFLPKDHGKEFGPRLEVGLEPQCTALSKGGVCIWLDALRSPNSDPGSMSTVHVVPGQICCKDRNYASVWDLSHASRNLSMEMPNAQFGTPRRSAASRVQAFMPPLKVHALVTERETEGTIGFAYEVTSDFPTRRLQPGILTEELLVSTARFPCLGATTFSDNQSMPVCSRLSGWEFRKNRLYSAKQFHVNHDVSFFLWEAPDSISKLLAIEGCRIESWHSPRSLQIISLLFLRSEQCMACLTRYWKDHSSTLMWEQSAYRDIGGLWSDVPCFIHLI